jgi:hypothetical protein
MQLMFNGVIKEQKFIKIIALPMSVTLSQNNLASESVTGCTETKEDCSF